MNNQFFYILSIKILFQKKKICIGNALKKLSASGNIEDYKNFIKSIKVSKLKKKDKFFFIIIGIYLFNKNIKLKKKYYFLSYEDKQFVFHDNVSYNNADNIYFSNSKKLIETDNNFTINYYLSNLGISKSEEISIFNYSYEKFETLKNFYFDKKDNLNFFNLFKNAQFNQYVMRQVLKRITLKKKDKNVYWAYIRNHKLILNKKSKFLILLTLYFKKFLKFIPFKIVFFSKILFYINYFLKIIKETILWYFLSILIFLLFKEKFKYIIDLKNLILLNLQKHDKKKKYVLLLCLGSINSNYFFYTTKLLKTDINNNYIIITNDPQVYYYFYIRNKIVYLIQYNIIKKKKFLKIDTNKIYDFLYEKENLELVYDHTSITEYEYYYDLFLKIFKKINIVSSISFTTISHIYIAMIKASEENNIKTFNIPVVTIANHKRSIPYDYKSKFVFSYGEQCTEALKKNNYQGKIIEVGNIHYEKKCEIKFENKKNLFIKKIYPINKNLKKIILFSTSGIHENEYEILKKLSIICKKLNFLIIVKQHQDILTDFKNLENVVLFNSEIKSEKLIKYCDIFITDYSSSGILAVLEKKFLLVLNFLDEDFPSNNYDKFGVAKKITDTYNLEKNLYDIEYGKFEIKDYQKNFENFKKLFNKNNYSNATSEVINNFVINNLYQ